MDRFHLLEFAPEGFVVLDDALRVRFVNAAAVRLMDASEAAFRGAPVWEAVPLVCEPDFESCIRRVWSVRGTETWVGTLHDGRTTVRVSACATEDGLVISLGDMTAQRATEQALRSREEQLARVLSATGSAAFDLDLERNRSFLDKHVGAIFGYGEGDAPSDWSDYEQHFDPAHFDAFKVAAIAAMHAGRPFVCDCRITRVDGSIGWVRLRGELLANARGVPVSSSGTMLDITTERARAAALQESERQLRTAQRLAGVGSWSWDIRSGAVSWSEQMFRIAGHDPDTTTASFDLVLAMAVDDVHREEFSAHLQRALYHDDAYDFEMPIRRTDGSIRRLHTRGEVERDDTGTTVRMTGTVVDVTERRQAEESLRRSEQELYRAQRMARIGSFVRSAKTGELWWSPMTRTILEIAEDVEPTLELALSRFPKHEAARYHALLQRAADTGEPFELEAETVMPSGRHLVVRLSGEIDFDAKGDALSVHGLMADITAQREQEHALRESEVRFRTLWEASPIGIRLTDANGVTLYANPKLLEMFDCSFEEFRTEQWRDRIHAEDRDRVASEGRDSVRNARDKRVDYRIVRRDGRVLYVRATVAVIRSPDGKFAGHVGALEDLTEETEARREKDRLEQQMHQAQKLESLGVLAGGIAHDFNNLLVGVLTNASMALMDLAPESPVYDTVRDIERAAQRAADLTRQLLAYSGKGRFIIEPLSLSELAVEMTQLLWTVVSKKARLHLDVQHDLPFVRGDATQLRQVVMNLITNASDSLGDGDGDILLRTQLVDVTNHSLGTVMFGGPLRTGPHVVLEVADTGAGMELETVQRIFDPFFTTKFTGRGLGLAATIGIVRGHDGAIAVTSAPGKGTSFSLYFPIGGGVRREVPPSPTTALVGHGSILVVDDDDGVRAVARSLLQRQGFNVVLAANGREAVELFAKYRADVRVVLLDLTMPVMGGEETLHRLRAADPTVRVILMSGYSDVDVEGTFARAGLSGFLQKPFRADDVCRSLALALADN